MPGGAAFPLWKAAEQGFETHGNRRSQAPEAEELQKGLETRRGGAPRAAQQGCFQSPPASR